MNRLWIAIWVPALCAQVVPGRYIVELDGAPAAVQSRTGRAPSLAARRAAVRAEQAGLRPHLRNLGARVLAGVETVANALIVEIPDQDAPRLRSHAGVARVHPVRLMRPFLDHSLPLHKVPQAWAAIGGAANAGAGIKIAILDSGIAQDHPGFQDASLAIPPGFPLANKPADLAYTTNKVIVARNYVSGGTPKDSFGHGTALAMEAAGIANSGPLGVISGVAPKAWLASYKVYQDQNLFGEDTVLQGLDDAVNDGMDVINLSFGIAVAERVEDDVLVAALERAAAMGIVITVAAGNNGDAPNTIASPATAPSVIAVGASSNDRSFAPGAVALNGTPAYYALPAAALRSSIPVTAPIVDVATLDATGEACAPLAPASLAGAIALILRSPLTGRPCLFQDKLNNAQNAGALAAIVYMNADSPELVSMDVRGSTLPAVSVDRASGLAIRNHAPERATVYFTTTPFARDPNRIAPFSSHGPNLDAAIKPDLAATGLYVYTATENTNPNSILYGATGYIKEADGTSFAAPLVAGAAAVLKSARPGLTAAQYRSLLVNSAAPSQFPVQWTGAGTLNLEAALANTVSVAPVSLSFGAGDGTVALTKSLTITNLGTADDTFAISFAPAGAGPSLSASANVVSIPAGGSLQVSTNLAGSQLAPGEYQGFLHIHGTQSAVDTIVPYWYGVPDGIPKYITELQGPDSAFPGSLEEIYFRITDQTGLPLPAASPKVKVIAGQGSVVDVSSQDARSPGVFRAMVLLDEFDGANIFEIDAGTISQRISITGTSTGF